MALTKLSTDVIDLSGNTTALTIPSGTTSNTNLDAVDWLVVAGGGAGANSGGGGGAGGLRTSYGSTAPGTTGTIESKLTLAHSVAYTVVVGSGGPGMASGSSTTTSGYSHQGMQGMESSISGTGITTITTVGGGGGGSNYGTASGTLPFVLSPSGGDGGSGGGQGNSNYGSIVVGSGTANQGFDGGSMTFGSPYPGAGGGGASALGGNRSGSTGGVGGAGITVGITTGSDAYAGGGGGGAAYTGASPGAGGSGGGGGGGTVSGPGSYGTDNTGSGGGAGGDQQASGGGGDGVVVLRYPSIFTATYTPNNSAYLSTCNYPVGASCTALYQLESDGTDTCGNTNLAVSGSVSFVSGRFGNCAEFNGSAGNYLSGSAIVTGNPDFSVSFWVYPTAINGTPIAIGTHNNTGGYFLTFINSQYALNLGRWGDDLGNTGKDSVPQNEWTHICITSNAGAGIAYINGAPAINFSTTYNISGNTYIGAASASNQPFTGKIDQVRWFTSVLSQSQVLDLYAGLADAEVTDGTEKYLKITAGTGTVTFSNSATTSGRPTSPAEGLLRDNTDTGALEFYNGSLWQQIAGTLVSDYTPPTATGNFITTLFNGNNTTVTTGFQADLAWVSNRQYANGNFIYDSVRGASNNLWPTGNYAEGVRSGVTAFNATDTTIGTYSSIGSGGSGTNVQWAWKAGGTAVSNPDGTTTSTISKNATAGFSIVKTSSAGGTINVGHGLGSDIGMIILKGVDVAEDWQVWHKDVGTGKYLLLSSTAAQTTRANSFSTVNSTIFENDWTSGSVIWIAYCWSSISGYSKIGSYAGTGSGNTQSINTGFEVGWVMIKDYTAGGSWFVQDNKRGSQNSITVNTGTAESTTNYVTFTSTGFDVTSGLNDNSVSSSFIYMAFRS
jgi:hypothetical protein